MPSDSAKVAPRGVHKLKADRLTPVVFEVRATPNASSWEVVAHLLGEREPLVVFRGMDPYQAHGVAQALQTYYRQHRPPRPIDESGLYPVARGEYFAGAPDAPAFRPHLHLVEG